MEEADWWFGRRTTIESAVDAIMDANRNGRGLSIVRLGDGEGAVIDKPEAGDPEFRNNLQTWFGNDVPSDDAIKVISSELLAACRSANMLGLPSRFQFDRHDDYKRVFLALAENELPANGQQLVDANFHWYLQLSGAFSKILTGQPVVGTIGCRDLTSILTEIFFVRSVQSFFVRGESGFPGENDELHWPQGFERIMRDLTIHHPGQIFLVGAGPLGKIYCQRIKELGGVAIDIGSIFDAWLNVDSRLRFPKHRDLFSPSRHQQVGQLSLREALQIGCETAEIVQASF